MCVPVYKVGVLGGIAGPSGDIRLVKFMSKIKGPPERPTTPLNTVKQSKLHRH
jgi:hypothetical protein